MSVIRDHMIIDPGLQAEVLARVRAGGFGDTPARSTEALGEIFVPGLGVKNLFLRHAADAILISHGQVVLITRLHAPGAGKLALPGGFIDAPNGVVEAPLVTARREAVEETGISADLLAGIPCISIGPRRYDRPFDIRAAWRAMPDAGIGFEDVFVVSTQGFLFEVPVDLKGLGLVAGDDAGGVQVFEIAGLRADLFAVPDHLDMIRQASRLVLG